MKKITLATVKAFIRKNADNIYVKNNSSFDGMTDCVQSVKEDFKKIDSELALGVKGVWIVGNSNDSFLPFENEFYIGFTIYNCCGEGIVAARKSKEE